MNTRNSSSRRCTWLFLTRVGGLGPTQSIIFSIRPRGTIRLTAGVYARWYLFLIGYNTSASVVCLGQKPTQAPSLPIRPDLIPEFSSSKRKYAMIMPSSILDFLILFCTIGVWGQSDGVWRYLKAIDDSEAASILCKEFADPCNEWV